MGILESFALILQKFQASRALGTPALPCALPSLTVAAVSVPVLRKDRREATADTFLMKAGREFTDGKVSVKQRGLVLLQIATTCPGLKK